MQYIFTGFKTTTITAYSIYRSWVQNSDSKYHTPMSLDTPTWHPVNQTLPLLYVLIGYLHMQIGYKCYSPTLPCRFVSDYVTFLETTSYYSSLSFGSDSPLPCLPWLLSISSCSNLDSPHFVTAPTKLYRDTIIDNRLPLHLLPRLEIPFLTAKPLQVYPWLCIVTIRKQPILLQFLYFITRLGI